MNAAAEQKYDFDVVRWFAVMAAVYLVVGALVGVYIAAELAWPALNFDSPYISFGRLRPLHTNAVIFAFGGCILMATAFYSVQRTCGVRLWSNKMAWFTFWGWNLIIVSAVITLPLGITQGKEYAELEWPIDIAIAVVWLSYFLNFVMTVANRKSSHIYVSNWFFMGMMLMITYLHVVNSLSMPVELFKSYSIFSGVQDAMIQWWWGHNAVGFYLGLAYLLKVAYTMDEKYWPDEEKSISGVRSGNRFRDKYVPAKDIAGRHVVAVDYGFTFSGYQGFLQTVQANQAGLMPLRRAVEAMPGVSDANLLLREMELEKMDEVGHALFMTLAQNGQLDMVLWSNIRKDMAKKGWALNEAIEKYQDEIAARAEQAQAQGQANALESGAAPQEGEAEPALPGLPPTAVI